MAARNDDRRDAQYDQHDGVDALMAAITDEPLPEGALDDAGFAAEHRSALADVALLREQLGLIGEALAADGLTVGGTEPEALAPSGRPTAARPAPGTEGAARHPRETDAETRPAPAPAPPVRSAPTRATRRRRPGVFALAFGTLAAAVAASLVLGVGWLIAHNGVGSSTTSADSASAKEDSGSGQSGSKAAQLAPWLSCARLIVEGTVASVEPVPGTGQNRITLDVDRYYKPAKGDDELVFPLDEGFEPRLRKGEHVLIGIQRKAAQPELVATGAKEIARERARILEALPASGNLPCD